MNEDSCAICDIELGAKIECQNCRYGTQKMNDVLLCSYYNIAKLLVGYCDKWEGRSNEPKNDCI